MSNQTKYNSFRRTYPEMVYAGYEYGVQPDGLHIVFTFRIGEDIVFSPTAMIPNRPFLKWDNLQKRIDRLVFNIGMIELVSYWKCYCPPRVRVLCGSLEADEVEFWKKTYFNGLGEFFYVNGIEATQEDFMEIVSEGKAKDCNPEKGSTHLAQDATLVPVGGGKDSVVTLSLLGEATRVVPLIMNPRGATTNCVTAAGLTMEDTLVIQRTIHPRLLELNREGCLNGHTPFSAMLAFYTLLASELSGIGNIALSNESSANEPTVLAGKAGANVNHQYSKSLEFENDFRSFVSRFVCGEYNYYSFLRPLTELQIAMLFSKEEVFFDVFRSCNAGSKEDIWCGKCAKCLFAFIILSPFIAPERLTSIFGKNLLEDEGLRLFFEQLTGHAPTKPFECVGTVDEVNSALSMAITRWYKDRRPRLLTNYHPLPPNTPLATLQASHNLTPQLFNLLAKHVQAAAID